jgi:hypothetical protein
VTLANDANCRFPVLPRHLHVEEHDIRVQSIVAFDSLDTVCGLADDIDVGF